MREERHFKQENNNCYNYNGEQRREIDGLLFLLKYYLYTNCFINYFTDPNSTPGSRDYFPHFEGAETKV